MTRPTPGQVMLAARRLVDDVTRQYDAEQAAYRRGAEDGWTSGQTTGYRDGYGDGYDAGVEAGAGRVLLSLQHLLVGDALGPSHDELVVLHRQHMVAVGAIPRRRTGDGPLEMGTPHTHADRDVAA